MAFFSRFFATPERAPLPTLEELLEARGLLASLPALEPLREEFLPLNAEERMHWADAVLDLQAHGWPLPPVWLDAQYDLAPQIVPAWLAEREGYYFKPWIEGLALRITACGQVMPAAWLAMWGVGAAEVTERAMDQLREKSKGLPFQRLASGIYQGCFPDGHSSSRMLLPELWSGLFPGQNTFVAVPAQDVLLVSPQVLLPKLVEAIGKGVQGPGPRVLATIFQQMGDKFMPANLQDPHPIAQPQRELRQTDLLEAYRAQEADLPGALGDPAPLGVLKTQQGRSVSFATWQEGRPTLMPETDLVGFVASNGRPLGIFFSKTLPRLAEIRGTLVDFWGPRRMRYEGFPTAAQLERLECFATAEQMSSMFKNAPAQPTPSKAPATQQSLAASGALSAQISSPVPQHLRGISLGTQNAD
jgi:hypothetical protein